MKEDGARLFPVMSSDMPVASCPTGTQEHQETLFVLCGWQNIATGCPESLWGLRSWRYSEAAWMRAPGQAAPGAPA